MGIRVGTWNVQYARGVERNERRRALLESRRADVWVLTETHDDLDLSSSHEPVHSLPRYSQAGGRWTTIWSSLPVLERLEVADPGRCVAARLGHGTSEVVVYGTVLPWLGDAGPDPDRPGRGWSEFTRVAPSQAAEWRALRQRFPDALLVVAGDLNQDLGGKHYYGSKACREILRTGLSGAGLTCLTETGSFADGEIDHPPIDHVCASPSAERSLTASVEGWNRDIDGVRLSDHGGTLAEIQMSPHERRRGWH